MTYCDLTYLIVFLPIVMLIYSICKQKHRSKVLLLASYVFFWSISGKLIIYLLLSTLSIHHFGLWLEAIKRERDEKLKEAKKEEKKQLKELYTKKQRKVLFFAVILHIGLLVVLKYTPFFGRNIKTILSLLNIPITLNIPRFLIPIGISFYTFQAVSYMVDVYRETIKADKNLLRLALFMSFFPQIMEGPIARYSETAIDLYEGNKIEYKNMTFGIQRILFGCMKKVVIADRLNILIKTIFNDYAMYDGGIALLGAIAYTIQLYMEFSGTMDIVIGSGQIFNVKIPENFRQPFFSKTISEFWQRWHITLGRWFKDYIFYPLSLSKPLKKLTSFGRKHLGNHFGPLLAGSIALFCVWISNGLWHGAGWKYIFFGMFHFTLILCGNIFEPLTRKITDVLHINRQKLPFKVFQMIRTTCLVIIGELFFRAKGLKAGLEMFNKIITNFSFSALTNGLILNLGMDIYDFIIVLITMLIVFVISVLKEKNVEIRENISKKNIIIRWTIYYSLILFIIIFGAYGNNYIPVTPIYAEF